MPDDRRLTVLTSARTSPDEVARHTFATARRGFDPAEVRAYLETLARALHEAADREEQLRQAVAEAEQRAAHPVLDETTLTNALGQETSRVLRSAQDAAAELVARAEAETAHLRSQVQDEAVQVQARADQSAADRTAQAENVATELRRRAKEEADARVENARLEAEALLTQARTEGRAMVQEAQELRGRVLADLSRRRRVLHSQIEQLRAGRERLAETISDVRHSVDRITDELFRAEDEARLAAEAAGRQALAQDAQGDGGSDETAVEATHPSEPDDTGVIANVSTTPVTSTTAVEDDQPMPAQAVEELFARLRADRVAQGQKETDQPAAGDTTSPGGGALVPGGERGNAAQQGTDSEPDEVVAVVAPELLRRAELMEPVVAGLGRRLKRALQDDQNDILDRLRGTRGWTPDVLPGEDEHTQRYFKAALDPLTEAARAGVTFAGGGTDIPSVDVAAEELAREIVIPLRRRLEEDTTDAGDDAALVERVGAAFREWKGARLERLAGDQAVAAFSLAVLSATEPKSELRWVVDDDGVECPDCDDNALAGPVRVGEEFPTGHLHPPAHSGCRCLLVPATA